MDEAISGDKSVGEFLVLERGLLTQSYLTHDGSVARGASEAVGENGPVAMIWSFEFAGTSGFTLPRTRRQTALARMHIMPLSDN